MDTTLNSSSGDDIEILDDDLDKIEVQPLESEEDSNGHSPFVLNALKTNSQTANAPTYQPLLNVGSIAMDTEASMGTSLGEGIRIGNGIELPAYTTIQQQFSSVKTEQPEAMTMLLEDYMLNHPLPLQEPEISSGK